MRNFKSFTQIPCSGYYTQLVTHLKNKLRLHWGLLSPMWWWCFLEKKNCLTCLTFKMTDFTVHQWSYNFPISDPRVSMTAPKSPKSYCNCKACSAWAGRCRWTPCAGRWRHWRQESWWRWWARCRCGRHSCCSASWTRSRRVHSESWTWCHHTYWNCAPCLKRKDVINVMNSEWNSSSTLILSKGFLVGLSLKNTSWKWVHLEYGVYLNASSQWRCKTKHPSKPLSFNQLRTGLDIRKAYILFLTDVMWCKSSQQRFWFV